MGKRSAWHGTSTIDGSDAKIHDILRGVIESLKDEGGDGKVMVGVEAECEISDQMLKMEVEETLIAPRATVIGDDLWSQMTSPVAGKVTT